MILNVTLLIPSTWLAALGLPEHLQDSKEEVVRVVKAALVLFLNGDADPQQLADVAQTDVTNVPVHRVMFSLPTREATVLNALAAKLLLTPGPVAKRIVATVAAKHHQIAAMPAQDQVDASHPVALAIQKLNQHYNSNFVPRAAQAACYDNIWESLSTGSIGLVEAATGIGKTRAMVLAAARWVHERQANIGICAPTIALLRQFQAEYDRLRGVMDMAPLQLIIGRREFVSEVNLREFLMDEGSKWNTPAVRSWLEHGYDIASQSPAEAWQVHGLLLVAPDIPVIEVALLDVSLASDRGYKAYREQFVLERAAGADGDGPARPSLLLFTHAMLAQDMRRKSMAAGNDETYREIRKAYFEALVGMKGKKFSTHAEDWERIALLESELGVAFDEASDGRGILPVFTGLLVDEAHALEESFSNSLSEYLSLRSIVRDLGHFKDLGGRLPEAAMQLVGEALVVLSRNSGDGNGLRALKSAVEFHSALLIIAQVCDGISRVRDAASEKARVALRLRRAGVLLRMATGRNLQQAFFQQSPVRHYPRVFISPVNVSGLLSRLWSSLDCGALLSATLYISGGEGPTGTFMAGLLKIPGYKQKLFTPIYANWSAACVQGVYMAMSGDGWLLPPTQPRAAKGASEMALDRDRFVKDEARWHQEVAQTVAQIYGGAAGGVLVLCTSYATVEAVGALLLDMPALSGVSVVQARAEFALRMQTREFMQLSQERRRVLWLAVGSAWTGVDVGGHDPWRDLFGHEITAQTDNVLTDLVIPRLPYGVNQSLSHLWRVRNEPHVPWDLLDAAFRFKQALGRLVRRAGLPVNRRIHVLDTRLSDVQNRSRMAIFLNSLSRYRTVPVTRPKS